jgi:hypothetical protein
MTEEQRGDIGEFIVTMRAEVEMTIVSGSSPVLAEAKRRLEED